MVPIQSKRLIKLKFLTIESLSYVFLFSDTNISHTTNWNLTYGIKLTQNLSWNKGILYISKLVYIFIFHLIKVLIARVCLRVWSVIKLVVGQITTPVLEILILFHITFAKNLLTLASMFVYLTFGVTIICLKEIFINYPICKKGSACW